MSSIYWIVLDAIEKGWLSLADEQQIKKLFDTQPDLYKRDLEILLELQRAVNDGRVKREVVEIRQPFQERLGKQQVA